MMTSALQIGGEKRDTHLTLAAILLVAAALRFYSLADESFWFDEAYSVWVARHGVIWHLALSTQRIFPPLYYLLLHFWLRLGSSDWAVRALSAIIGTASIWVAFALARELFGDKVGLISALLLAISPLHLWYSQEARMYILVAALGLCSAYFMWLALRRGHRNYWLAYVVTSALAMNAHYFAIFLVPFQNLVAVYLWLRHRVNNRTFWRQWVPSQICVGLLSVLGLAGIFSSESGYWWGLLDSWHGAPTLSDLVDLMSSFSVGTTAQGPLIYWSGLVLFGFCAVWGVAPREQGHWRLGDALFFALCYLVIPLGAVFVASQARSFWVLRYIFPFLPPYCILVARGIGRMPRAMAGLALAAVVALSVWPIVNTYRYRQKEDWRAVSGDLSANEREGDLVLLVDEDIWIPFEHYYRGTTRWVGISRTVTDRPLLKARVGMLMSYDRIWLVQSHTDNSAVRESLQASPGVQLEEQKRYTGITVDVFAVKPPVGQGAGL